jgi:signal transduction histidine kinase
VVEGQRYRQGVAIDCRRLMRSLEEATLTGHAREGQLRVDWSLSETSLPKGQVESASDERSYRRRFDEPFDALWATLHVSRLPGMSGSNYILGLSVLLLVVGSVGLLAVHRMVGVTVGFAERRNNFVAAVTHELKTPLTAIRMYGEMLRDGIVPSDEKRQQYYETITTESERLTRLVDNVLELARLERGERPVSLTAGAVEPVLREVAEILGPHAEAMGFELIVEAEDHLPAAKFDRDALLQVVLNLTDNAVKYAREATDRRIVLSCEHRESGIAVSVRDHGPGVPARHLPHIFEPFYRGENELTRRAKGTGIGLALVKGLVDRMGGSVTGTNVQPVGFEARVQLPVAVTPA